MPAIYPVFEKPLSSAEGFGGHSLSRGLEELDNLAQTLGLMPLSGFIDSNTMAREVFDDEELAGIDLPPVQWFEASEGLRTVSGLLAFISEQSDKSLSMFGDAVSAIETDLQQLAGLLEEALRSSNRFHLLVDI